MIKKITFFLLTIAFFASCKEQAKTTAEDSSAEQPAEENPNLFGADFKADSIADLGTVIQQLADKDTIDAVITGTVESVCKKKGCWMNIKSDQAGDTKMFVKFKDYGFFMPLDCEGRTVVMNGKAYKETTSVDELRHYAEDEGKSKEEIEAIVDPVDEYKFMADGVKFQN